MNLSRRKVLGGITTVGAASAAAGAGTFAAFFDKRASETSTISTGTVSLQDDSATGLNLTAKKKGSSAEDAFSGSVTFEYTGNVKANFVIGMDITDTAGSEDLASEIDLDTAKITIEKYNSSDDSYDSSVDSLDTGDTELPGQEDLEITSSPPSLSEVDSELDGSEPMEPGTTDPMTGLLYYDNLQKNDKVTLTVDGGWSGLSNDYQGEELQVTVYGAVTEP